MSLRTYRGKYTPSLNEINLYKKMMENAYEMSHSSAYDYFKEKYAKLKAKYVQVHGGYSLLAFMDE